MFNIEIPEHIKTFVSEQNNLYNLGQRRYGNGTKEQQWTGMIGQSTLLYCYGFPLQDYSGGVDGGFDIVIGDKRYDIKTMGREHDSRKHPEWVNNLYACQTEDWSPYGYIFCSYNKTNDVLTVCGWSPKEEAIQRAILKKKGEKRTRDDGTSFELEADLYEIYNSQLRQCRTLSDLYNQLKRGRE